MDLLFDMISMQTISGIEWGICKHIQEVCLIHLAIIIMQISDCEYKGINAHSHEEEHSKATS